MRAIMVVVVDEFRQDPSKAALVDRDQVVEALLAGDPVRFENHVTRLPAPGDSH
jgi:hypothetical protein